MNEAPKDTSIPTNPTLPSGPDDKPPATQVIPATKPKRASKKTTEANTPDDTQGDSATE